MSILHRRKQVRGRHCERDRCEGRPFQSDEHMTDDEKASAAGDAPPAAKKKAAAKKAAPKKKAKR